MANLQALGADNETIIWLSALGEGTELSPFKSVFASEQYGAWEVSLLNPSLAVTGAFYPEIQAVSQSGVWNITVTNQLTDYATRAKQDETIEKLQSINDRLLNGISVNTGLTQPLTNSQLRSEAIQVTQTSIPGLSIPNHNHVSLQYTGNDLTGVIYRQGGSTGTIVAVLSLTYQDGILRTITRS